MLILIDLEFIFPLLDQRPFDMDRDLSAVRVASEMGEATRAAVSPFAGDASLVIRITTLMSNAFFDALAPYHPTGNFVDNYRKIEARTSNYK